MSSKIKLVYFGTPLFSAELLNKIVDEGSDTFEVLCVITQPDKPVGRKHVMTASPVKIFAQDHDIPVLEGDDHKVVDILKNADIGVVFAFGQIIKKELLRASKYGLWNIHPSALPLYRGPSPVAFPLLLGDLESAISLIELDEKMDHGPIIAQKTVKILPNIMHDELLLEMAQMSYYILFESVQKIKTDSLVLTAQDESNKTYTHLFSRESGYIDIDILKQLLANKVLEKSELPYVYQKFFEKNPNVIWNPPTGKMLLWNMYRALHPWPGLWTEVKTSNGKKRLKIVEMNYSNGDRRIEKVQLEGKNPISYTKELIYAAQVEMSQ